MSAKPNKRVLAFRQKVLAASKKKRGPAQPKTKARIPIKEMREFQAGIDKLIRRWEANAWPAIQGPLKAWESNQKKKTDAKGPADDLISRLAASYQDSINVGRVRHLAQPVLVRVNKLGETTWKQQVQEVVGLGYPGDESEDFARILDEAIDESVSLITGNLGESADMRAMIELAQREGWGVDRLRRMLEQRFQVSRSRGFLIARDQTLTFNANVTETRHLEAGIERYRWMDSDDVRVRGTPKAMGGKWPNGNHFQLNGKIFEYKKPPIADPRTGQRSNPGKIFQCRCLGDPVFE